MVKIYYKTGEILGECIFLKETEEKHLPSGRAKRMGDFQCKCGDTFNALIDNVKRGLSTQCQKCCNRALGVCNTTHGCSLKGRKTREYKIWESMKNRCVNPNYRHYNDYGGRGIFVCERWIESFSNFLEDMGICPTVKHSIDRIENNKGYYKENCKWSTDKEQARNRRSNLVISYNGESNILIVWVEKLGLSYMKTYSRIVTQKWEPKKAFETD